MKSRGDLFTSAACAGQGGVWVRSRLSGTRVENPGHHSPNTLDCVTCHTATPATRLVVEPTLQLSAEGLAERFLPDPKLLTASEREATFDDQEPLTNVHAFSYTATGVGINQRTVNESAAVVEYLAKQMFPGQDR